MGTASQSAAYLQSQFNAYSLSCAMERMVLHFVLGKFGISLVENWEIVVNWRKELLALSAFRCCRDNFLESPTFGRGSPALLNLRGPGSPQP